LSQDLAQDEVVLEIQELRIKYGDRIVLESFSVTIGPGEVVALVGPSGSGKSSILNCVTGLQVPDRGRVIVCGTDLVGLRPALRADLRRRRMGVTYQQPALLPELTIEENVAITLLFDGMRRDIALVQAREALRSVGLEGHGSKRVDQVSGGEAQRVAFARSLVRDSAALVVADEPTASLDAASAIAIAELMVGAVKERGLGALVATHDDRVASRCDRVVDMRSLVGTA